MKLSKLVTQIIGVVLLVAGIILVAPFVWGAIHLTVGIVALVLGWYLVNTKKGLKW